MNKKLNRELAKEYFKLAPKAATSVCVLLVITLYFYWGDVSNFILISWVAINAIVAVAFVSASYLYKRYGSEDNSVGWLRTYMLLVFLQDVPFGFIAPISFMVENEVYWLVTLFMLGGMVAGGIVTRGMIFSIYMVHMSALLIPVSVSLYLQDTSVTYAMLALVVIYIIFMSSVAKNYSATVTRNILLWLDNEQLIAQLTSSYAEVEEANRILIGEIECRKKIEGELVEAKERSERASRAKNQFLATVSHELRTPLNGIVGFSDLLCGGVLHAKGAGYAFQISKSAEKLLHIVNDILDISAIEAGHLAFNEESFSLRSELSDVVMMLRPMAKRKKLTLELNIDNDVEDTLCGDANRLCQIISNLVTNAVKYTDNGGVGVHVSRQGGCDGQVTIRFEVEDTGIGIAKEQLDTIFDKFTRGEGFETRRDEGVGLGLAIVSNLVQCMGGSIAVRSRFDEGSCFSCDIPFSLSTEILQSRERDDVAVLTAEQWGRLKVLVVDDNEVNRMVLCAFLDKSGIPFVAMGNGYEALDCIRNDDIDVVLMDIQMPDISGIEVVRRIGEELTQLPRFIAVTAHAFPEQRKMILGAGFSDFLIKPISETVLLKILSAAYFEKHGEHEISDNRHVFA